MKNFFKKHATVVGIIATAATAAAIAAAAIVTGKVIIPGTSTGE